MFRSISHSHLAHRRTLDPDQADIRHPTVTSLHSAAHRGHVGIVDSLLRAGLRDPNQKRFEAFVNQKNRWGKSALLDATLKGIPEIVRCLLKNGAQYFDANQAQETVLHIAAFNGHPAIAQAVLEHGSSDQDHHRFLAFVNHKNKKQKTALIEAAENGRPNIMRQILRHGADHTLVDGDSFSALHYCAFRNRIDCVRVLLQHASADGDVQRFKSFLNQRSTSNGASALQDVARKGASHNEVAKMLLNYRPAYDNLDSRHHTPLHHAIGNGNIDLAKWLLEYAKEDFDAERLATFVNQTHCDGNSAWKEATQLKQDVVLDALRATGVVQM